METSVTEKTVRQFIQEIGDQHFALAGAVIAASAAQAAALGEACMQISLDNQVDILTWQDVTPRIEQMAHIKDTLVEWCNQDASAIAQFAASREASEDDISSQQLLCESPAEIGRLSIEAAVLLQDFRSLVSEQVQDDLEVTISLLAGTARAAMLLLDSNLRIWPGPALLKEYEPILADLEEQLGHLTPAVRIRV